MDPLILDALNAAALRPEPTCANHAGLYAPREHEGKRLCWDCWKALGIPEKRPYLRWLGPATPKWEKDLLTGATEPRIWNDPIEVALREYGDRKPQTYKGGRR